MTLNEQVSRIPSHLFFLPFSTTASENMLGGYLTTYSTTSICITLYSVLWLWCVFTWNLYLYLTNTRTPSDCRCSYWSFFPITERYSSSTGASSDRSFPPRFSFPLPLDHTRSLGSSALCACRNARAAQAGRIFCFWTVRTPREQRGLWRISDDVYV